MYHGVKSGGDSSKTKSHVCCSDSYIVVSNLCRLCSEVGSILVIIVSSFASVPVGDPEEEGMCFGWPPVPGLSSESFPCSCPR